MEQRREFTAVNSQNGMIPQQYVHSCEHQAALRLPISAMTIGPQENSPAAALAVSARKYPPGDLMSAKRSNMATMTIEACSGPMKRCASSQADALIPMAGRT